MTAVTTYKHKQKQKNVTPKKHLLSSCCLLLLPHTTAALTTSLNLLLQSTLTLLLNLKSVDVLDQNPLVTELVTLSLKVKLPVKVTVDLLLLTVLRQSTADNTDTTDPLPLVAKTSVLSTTALTKATVTTKTLRNNALTVTSLRVHANWTTVDDAVVDKLTDLLTRVRHRNR